MRLTKKHKQEIEDIGGGEWYSTSNLETFYEVAKFMLNAGNTWDDTIYVLSAIYSATSSEYGN